jgi:STE24 endopeptidase
MDSAAHVASALPGAVAPQRITGLPLRWAVITLVVLTIVLIVVVLVTTPWAIGVKSPLVVDPTADLTPAQIAAAHSYHVRLLAPVLLGYFAPIVTVALLGFTTLGARLVVAAGSWVGGSFWARLLVGSALIVLLENIVVLPFTAWGHVVRSSVGLDLRSWSVWALDATKSIAVGGVITWLALVAVIVIARWKPNTWWLILGIGTAVLVVLGSMLVPVLIDPIFTKTTPLPDGPLRTEIMALAEAAGTPVKTVVVADTSSRTSAVNAHVSGLGPTRRVVLDDTLLKQATPEEIKLVVAHELGHAARNDVARATLVGAIAGAVVIVLIFVLLANGRLLARAGAASVGDPRAVALLVALVSVITLLLTPLANNISRHVEARADLAALNLTKDPAGFVAMQRRLSTANLSDPHQPFIVRQLFGTHPTLPERTAMARAWALDHGMEVPAKVGP